MRNQATTHDAGNLAFAISYLEEEHETLMVLDEQTPELHTA